MYIPPKHLLGVKRFDRTRFRPVVNALAESERANGSKPSDVANRLP